MAFDIKTLTDYVNDNRGFTSSGTVTLHTGYSVPEVKKNCGNCGSNQIEGNECLHCGTWYGFGAKPKPVKLPPVNPQRIECYEKPKQPFLYRTLDRIFKR